MPGFDPAVGQRIAETLQLQPHPEGGWYRETWRGGAGVGSRAAGSAILYLLNAGETSAWHRIDATEIWHHYAGAALELTVWGEHDRPRSTLLGDDVTAGEVPQVVVPSGCWQRARPLGEYGLVGCTVTPAFEFAGFELAPPGWSPGPEPPPS